MDDDPGTTTTTTNEQINFNQKHALARRRMEKCLHILQDRFEILQISRYPAEKMTKIVNACCALYNIALDSGCYSDICDDDNDVSNEGIFSQPSNGHSDDGPETNPYYSFGSRIRDEMMRFLSD